jgi:hypothetical protein
MRPRLLVLLAVLVASAALAATASAHDPGTDGAINGRACGPVSGVSKYGPVGVTARGVSCRLARQVAAGSVRGTRFERWRCTGKRTRFGHCHGRGIRRGAAVGWYAYH